ncbi:hypothetical protein ASPZODRAFT_141621 [Penicilliopsis zonata CBS 506.65]|uniref:Zn(2)-C6 fungal-type domain-containing protein n=1 Tax=Penicilliopsis zonata CBS 506.65 TaxID=1073090 RepID=A0A1L9SIH4_9EURO|nr:hypothetical protein ASPZODRAFT_141621 [Penicilliopsis zonata CBS 506.65]OJJ46834.1 hypothetical protein ASPZODRAFT_141621 [Penicilliopsis zonata CBS 506.65]
MDLDDVRCRGSPKSSFLLLKYHWSIRRISCVGSKEFRYTMQSNKPNITSSRKSRQKRWAPKTRAGCLTCRIRKIKCDEAKPSCQKCLSTGRKCDGYQEAVQVKPADPSPHLALSAWDLLSQNPDEKKNFAFFCSVTTGHLAGSFDLDFWSRQLLQISHQYPTLWHGVIALACIHREFITESAPPTLPRVGESLKLSFALQQFNKSIQSLTQIISQKWLSNFDKQVVLITSILYTCLCILQGRQLQAFMHLRNGLRLFHQWKAGVKFLDSSDDSSSTDNMFLLIFTRLDTQLRPYLASQPAVLPWTEHNQVIPASTTDAPFASIFDAYALLEQLFNSVIQVVLNQNLLSSAISHQKQRYSLLFQKWDARLSRLFSRNPEYRQDKALDLIRSRRLFAHIFLSLDISQGELAHDVLLDDYSELVETASRILENSPATSVPSHHPTFSLETAVVEALYWTGVHCREPNIRRRALRLLHQYPRREGICEGMLAAKMVENAMRLEETACSEPSPASPCTHGQWVCEKHRVSAWEYILITDRQIRIVMRTVEDVALARPGTDFVALWW